MLNAGSDRIIIDASHLSVALVISNNCQYADLDKTLSHFTTSRKSFYLEQKVMNEEINKFINQIKIILVTIIYLI